MAEPWLSVLMPVHGGAHYLPATLESAIAARPVGVEFLIYDSSSDAACRDIVKGYADRLAIRYRAMPELKGWPDKTNLAAADARAPHVAMLHQDDLWLPGHVEAAKAAIATHPDAVMSVAASRFIDPDGSDLGPWSLPLAPGLYSGQAFGQRLIVQNFLAILSPVIRRDAWLATGGLDAGLWYTADWDLYLKLAQQGSIAIRPHVTTAFRIHGNSLTVTGSRNADALRTQLEVVLNRYGDALGLDADRRRRAQARASIEINCGSAAIAGGDMGAMARALTAAGRLGPRNLWCYLRDSRIIERLRPRLMLKLRGVL